MLPTRLSRRALPAEMRQRGAGKAVCLQRALLAVYNKKERSKAARLRFRGILIEMRATGMSKYDC